jgi:hypothetical protein
VGSDCRRGQHYAGAHREPPSGLGLGAPPPLPPVGDFSCSVMTDSLPFMKPRPFLGPGLRGLGDCGVGVCGSDDCGAHVVSGEGRHSGGGVNTR